MANGTIHGLAQIQRTRLRIGELRLNAALRRVIRVPIVAAMRGTGHTTIPILTSGYPTTVAPIR
jgi:hypothetical protein